MGSGPVRVRADDATNVVVIHASLNALSVVYAGLETLRRSWSRLSDARRTEILSMVQTQAAHASHLLVDTQEAPTVIYLEDDRRGEPPYFVVLRQAVAALDFTRATALTVRPEVDELPAADERLLDELLRKTEHLSKELHSLMWRISTGLASTLDALRL